MRKSNLHFALLSILLFSCASHKPTICDCIEETIEQAIEEREKGMLTFDATVTPKCHELLDGATTEQRMEMNKSARNCPDYYKLDSLQKLKEQDWLKDIEKR